MACGKNEFILDFNLAKEVTDNYNVTYYATDTKGGLTIQAVASVREGKCELKGATKLPTLVYVTARKSPYPLILMAEKGEKIGIEGQGKDPLEWEVEGNPINKTLTEWRLENYEVLSSNQVDSVNSIVGKFVKNNPENPVSTILMLCYFNRKIDEKGYSDLMASLRGEAKDTKWLKLIGRTDQIFHAYAYPARLESLILRSTNKKGDTLLINHKKPVFLFFWHTGYTDKKIMVDSLKVLEKEIPDTSLLVADICLDVDSLAWRSGIRRDSLEKIKRFWVPLGVSDPTMMKIKVDALPYFIVFNKEGHQHYRGNDLNEAMKEYRELYETTDSI